MISFQQLWLFSLVVKLLLAGLLPLFSDEAYYWVWSHHLDLSYYDHPPMVSWLFLLGHPFESLAHFVRLPFVILSHLTLLFWYHLLKNQFNVNQMTIFLALCLLNPLFGLGGLIATPDVPLMFFWSLSVFSFIRAFQTQKLLWYVALGVGLGLGFCSKYHIALFPLLAFSWISFSKNWGKVKIKYIFVTILIGFVFSLPVFYWNSQNNWDSIAFQLNHGLGSNNWSIKWSWQYLLGQIGLLFPPICYFAISFAKNNKTHWLTTFALIPLIFFFISSLNSRVEANWPIVAYPAFLAMAVLYKSKLSASWIKGTVVFWAVGTAFITSFIFLDWAPGDIKKTKIKEFNEYSVLTPLVAKYQPLYAGSYQMAASMSYSSKKMIYKLFDMHRKDFYDYTTKSKPKGKSFFIIKRDNQTLPQWVKSHLQKKELVEKINRFEIVKVELK